MPVPLRYGRAGRHRPSDERQADQHHRPGPQAVRQAEQEAQGVQEMTRLRCLAVRPSQAQTNTHPGSPCLRETHYSEQAELFGGDHTAGPRGLRRRGSAILPRARQIFRAESRTRCIPSYTASGLHHPAQSPPCGPAGRMGACGRMTLPGRQAIAGAGVPPSVFMIPARSSVLLTLHGAPNPA